MDTGDHVMTGVELLWGKRTDNDGNSGNDLRLAVQLQMVILEQEHLGRLRLTRAQPARPGKSCAASSDGTGGAFRLQVFDTPLTTRSTCLRTRPNVGFPGLLPTSTSL